MPAVGVDGTLLLPSAQFCEKLPRGFLRAKMNERMGVCVCARVHECVYVFVEACVHLCASNFNAITYLQVELC